MHPAMPARRSGAPRLIDWTGERLVPWAPDVQVVYEHFHRYLWAQPLVAGRRVLDLASGEGFGSALLADTAAAVTGVDIDERSVEHSRVNYVADNLDFQIASADDLSAFPDGTFDVVVAFEMIEHVADQDAVLAEIERVLASGGLLVVSTPERRAYSEATGFENPYHVHELTRDEFSALLAKRFSELALFAQRAVTGSRIEPLDARATGPARAVRLQRVCDDWRPAGPAEPLYLVAVAANGTLPELPAHSALSDYELRLIDEVRAQDEAVRQERENELLAERERLIAEVIERTRERDEAHARAQLAEETARRVQESAAWRLLERIRAIVGENTVVGRWLRAVMRAVFRLLGSSRR